MTWLVNIYKNGLRRSGKSPLFCIYCPSTATRKGVSQSLKSFLLDRRNNSHEKDAFIAGEEGPELILGKAGSTVFPADETDRIIDAVTNNYDDYSTSYTLAASAAGAGNEDGREEQTKHITLEIAGGSPIEVSGGSGTSKEDIVEILVANLRPALLNIVKDEIFEEGDGSYEH